MDHNSRKRKKRKSLVQTVKKKFMKNFSRTLGTRLDSDIHEYFLRVFQQSKQEFNDADDRQTFIDNVFSQTEGHEVDYSCNQLVSRIVESFLPECSESVLQRFLAAFSEDLRPLCCHQFASHVLETLLRISSKKVVSCQNYQPETTSEDYSDSSEIHLNFVLKVSKFLLNNIDEFILDTYANHVTRCAISCLCGNTEDLKNPPKHNKEHNLSSDHLPIKQFYPKEYKLPLQQFADWILNSHFFSEYANNVLLSGLVQSVLLSLQLKGNKKFLNKISIKLINEVYSQDVEGFDILQVLENQQAVHLLNAVIITSTDKVYEKILCKCFTGRLKDLSLSRTANYCVQKLIERSPTAESFNSIYEELNSSFEKIIENGHTGVLYSISKMCRNLQTNQKLFIKDLMRSLDNCGTGLIKKETSNFVLLLLFFDNNPPSFITGSKNIAINLHGCLILQEILKFRKPNKVVKCLLKIETSLFLKILSDQKGSHIANAFFSSKVSNDEYRNSFLEKLKDSYVSLATNKYGSFVFNALWKAADIDQKLCIVKELNCKESFLLSSPSGKYIAKTVGLETYRHQPKDWEKAQKQIIDSRQIFNDIIK